MSRDIDALQDMLARMDRLETVLGLKIDRFTESEQALSKCLKGMTLEVEELKSLKQLLEKSVPKTLDSSLKESAARIIPQFLPKLVEGFKKQTQEETESCIQEAKRIKEGVSHSISKAERFINSQKKEMVFRRWGMALCFCVGSLLTSISLFYYFPQHSYSYYSMGIETAKAAVVGQSVCSWPY
jgi:hypothetical protein